MPVSLWLMPLTFLVGRYELVHIDRRGVNCQEKSPYLLAVDILMARQAAGLLRQNLPPSIP